MGYGSMASEILKGNQPVGFTRQIVDFGHIMNAQLRLLGEGSMKNAKNVLVTGGAGFILDRTPARS